GLPEGDPPGLLDLMVVIGDIAGAVLEQVEADDLLDAAPLPLVGVGDLPQVVDQVGLDSGLLGDLAPGGLLRRLIPVEMALRQADHAPAVGRALNRGDHAHLPPAHDDAAGREFVASVAAANRRILPAAPR